MDAIVIKRATLTDADYCMDLIGQHRTFSNLKADYAAERADLDEMLAEQSCIMLVAVKLQRGILHYLGYAQLCPIVYAGGERDWGLSELFVLPEAASSGVEKALLAAVMSYSKLKDAKALLSEAACRSSRLKALYDSYEYV